MDTQLLTSKHTSQPADLKPGNGAVPQSVAEAEPTLTAQAVVATDKAAQAELSPQQLEEMAGEMEAFVGSFNRGLKFRVDEDSGRQVVSVVDTQSGDVIRQIPSEEMLEVVTRLAEASGGLIDIKV